MQDIVSSLAGSVTGAVRDGPRNSRCLGIHAWGKVYASGQLGAVLRAVADLEAPVHPEAQEAFCRVWQRVSLPMVWLDGSVPFDLFVDALRRLLPPPPADYAVSTLYRGQRRGDPVGVSWTRFPRVAEKFALHGNGSTRTPQHPDAIVLAVEPPASAIIACPHLWPPSRFGQGEGEVILDPRGLPL